MKRAKKGLLDGWIVRETESGKYASHTFATTKKDCRAFYWYLEERLDYGSAEIIKAHEISTGFAPGWEGK